MPLFGILGLGYLGQRLLPAAAWGLSHQQGFDLYLDSSWGQIPQEGSSIVLTIPPHPDRAINQALLHQWGAWMKQYRPQFTHLIYISSTAVYPQVEAVLDESCDLNPTSENGWARLETEQILAQYFTFCGLRCGGIYGPGRNLLTRLAQGKPTRSLDGPTHRIHVEDLARLVLTLTEKKLWPEKITVVDHNPAPVREVIEWLVEQKRITALVLPPPQLAMNRLLSNALLLDLPFQLHYPSYQEGY